MDRTWSQVNASAVRLPLLLESSGAGQDCCAACASMCRLMLSSRFSASAAAPAPLRGLPPASTERQHEHTHLSRWSMAWVEEPPTRQQGSLPERMGHAGRPSSPKVKDSWPHGNQGQQSDLS